MIASSGKKQGGECGHRQLLFVLNEVGQLKRVRHDRNKLLDVCYICGSGSQSIAKSLQNRIAMRQQKSWAFTLILVCT